MRQVSHMQVFSVLTVSVIYNGLHICGFAEHSGFLRNLSFHMLPDQETCKKSKLNVVGVAVAVVYCEGQDNSLHDPIATKGE